MSNNNIDIITMLLKRMETEYRQWNDRELEVAKGILGEFEARLPHKPR